MSLMEESGALFYASVLNLSSVSRTEHMALIFFHKVWNAKINFRKVTSERLWRVDKAAVSLLLSPRKARPGYLNCMHESVLISRNPLVERKMQNQKVFCMRKRESLLPLLLIPVIKTAGARFIFNELWSVTASDFTIHVSTVGSCCTANSSFAYYLEEFFSSALKVVTQTSMGFFRLSAFVPMDSGHMSQPFIVTKGQKKKILLLLFC